MHFTSRNLKACSHYNLDSNWFQTALAWICIDANCLCSHYNFILQKLHLKDTPSCNLVSGHGISLEAWGQVVLQHLCNYSMEQGMVRAASTWTTNRIYRCTKQNNEKGNGAELVQSRNHFLDKSFVLALLTLWVVLFTSCVMHRVWSTVITDWDIFGCVMHIA